MISCQKFILDRKPLNDEVGEDKGSYFLKINAGKLTYEKLPILNGCKYEPWGNTYD